MDGAQRVASPKGRGEHPAVLPVEMGSRGLPRHRRHRVFRAVLRLEAI
jgi:hypothetical protein